MAQKVELVKRLNTNESFLIAIGSRIPIIGTRVEIWIRETKPHEPKTVTSEETATAEEVAASKEAVMESAIVKRETTTARKAGSTSHAATAGGLCGDRY
jgi:hypothetical protein